MVALGVASGIFIVPILTFIAEVDVRVAIGTSLVSVIAYYSGKRCTFLKQRLTNVRLAILLEAAGPSRWSSRGPVRTSFANWPKRTSNYTARCRGRKVNCAAGEKARARISNVMTSPAIPDADRIMATMTNW